MTHQDLDHNPDSGAIDTDGGAHVGDVEAQTFVGRDINLNLEIRATGAELRELAELLVALLSARGAEVRDGKVVAGEQAVDIGPARVDALRQYLNRRPGVTQAERIDQYLLHLCVNPEFHQWQQRYVALSGGYRSVPELSPKFTAIRILGEGPQRQVERIQLEDIRAIVEADQPFILLAQPGAGKTTVLQRIALDKAFHYLQDENPQLIPLFVQMASQEADESPREFLARMWREAMPGNWTGSASEFHEALHQGRLCILCDALNEAQRRNYSERMSRWKQFAANLPKGNRLIFSCRLLDYEGELNVRQVEIDALKPQQIQDFAIRYLSATKGAQFWSALQAQHSDLLELAAVPYYLHMLTDVYDAEGRLPPHRAQLFDAFVQKLFRRELAKVSHPVPWIDEGAQQLALERLAFAMQQLGEGTSVSRAWALNNLPAQIVLPPAGEIESTPPENILVLARSASILAGRADGSVKFTHHLMQEYFAGYCMVRRLLDGEDLRDLWRVPSLEDEMPPAERGEWDPLPGPPTSGWEQTTILAAGLYPALYAAVQPVNPALAARCLLESGAERNEERLAQSQSDLLVRLGDIAIHPHSRMEAGLLLGRLGDPRFPVETINGVKVILPHMVAIAGGVATVGSGDDDELADDYEKPRHDVELAAYAIARYPVTNAEYSCFLAAGGYADERYWTAGGRYWLRGEKAPGEEDPADWWIRTWRRRRDNPQEIEDLLRQGILTEHNAKNWREYVQWSEDEFVRAVRQLYPQVGSTISEPRFWNDDSFNNPSQPVVGVCWYEAMAYANWLSAVTKQSYRLPTEAEWEWAARRGNRLYPWGSSWSPDKLNSLEGDKRVMRTTPMGVYPTGATPDGLEEMAGNVWEWTATRYADYPYDPDAKLEAPDATGSRISRGGGWSANRKMVRCACRAWNDPWDWNTYRGFRLAKASL